VQPVTRDHRLEQLVSDLRRYGLPEGNESLSKLTDDQLGIFAECERQWDEFMEVEVRKESGNATNQEKKRWITLRNVEMRLQFQKAILSGMIYLRFIQECAIYCGSIPDPNSSFKYFQSSNNQEATRDYYCWNCGAEVQVKTQHNSVWFRFPGGGILASGKVRTKKVQYCPNCEDEPASSGIVYESKPLSLN